MDPKNLDGTMIRFYIESLTAIGVVRHPHEADVKYFRIGVPLVSYHHHTPVLNNHFKFVIYVNGLDQDSNPESK